MGGAGTVGTGGVGPTGSSKPEVDVITIRRLNHTQYGNTLRALTGTATDYGSGFPADDLSFGFDNIGEALTLQPLHLEVYEKSADSVLAELFALPAGDARRAKVLSCDPNTAGHACILSTTLAFAERAFRRPVTEADVSRYVAIADDFVMTGGTGADALTLALKGILLSPNFLFRVELDPTPTSKDEHPLSAYELATRLSYYLWSSMPDDALFQSAKDGSLVTDQGLTTQVARMLGDQQAQALVDDFAGQWLNIRRVLMVKPDATTYPNFNADIAQAMQTETAMLFSEMLGKGRPLTELVTADYTYVNAPLAAYYGMAPPAGAGFTRVPVAGSHRTGFLMQGSFLTLTSNPTRTSPVKRGKWVLEQLLCSPPPPPPPGVNLAALDGGGQSVRAKLEAHRAKEPCHSCHSMMDPIGLSFENFDGVGTYRTADAYGPIDATGTLATPGGDVNFNGADQLVPILAQDSRLAPCAASKVLTYAVGRGFGMNDDALAVNNLLSEMNKSGQGLRGLIGGVTLSASFRKRRAVGE
jgi:hypothetical protein